MTITSVLTCPHCGCAKEEVLPESACQFFYVCSGCSAMLRPLPGECCVFCSFGDRRCPTAIPNCGPAPHDHGGCE